MKRTVLLFLALFSLMATGMAQSNVVKLGIPSLFYGRANLNYEYVLNEKTSINLRAGAQFPRNFPIEGFQQDQGPSDFRFTSGQYKAYGFMPSYRIYFGKNNPAPHGFYVAPYFSYNKNTFIFNLEYDNGNELNIPAEYNVGLTGIAGGIMIGNQWVINETFVLDFNYFGIGYGLLAGGIKFSSTDPNVNYEELRDEVQNQLENTSNTGGANQINEVQAFDDSIKIKSGGPAPHLKFSFSLGYMF